MTTRTIRKLKGERPVVAVTAYDTITAVLADRAGVDLILVGDSVGTTVLGFPTTVPVTLDMMVHHTAAVARARPRAFLVADLPFPEGRRDHDRLLDACARLMQEGGAEAVKLEGGADLAPGVGRLVAAGVAVFGHIGLMPQQVHQIGGYRKFGRRPGEREAILADARALQEAGAFALLGEMIEPAVAAEVRDAVEIPLIGIGSGPHCDGQILVSTDLLGLNIECYPGFVKRYAELADATQAAFHDFAEEVRSGAFPEK